MFPIHDRTRRWICRVIFILGGVLPMACVAAWAAVVHSASHVEAVRRQVAEVLGLEVRLASVSYPQPGVMLLEGLELADSQAKEPLASIRAAEIISDGKSQTILLSQPDVSLTRPQWLWTLVDGRLRRRADQAPLRLAAGEMTLRFRGGVQTLVDCNAQFESASQSDTLTAAFRLADVPATEPVRLRIERSIADGQPGSSFELDARAAAMPCSMLAALLERRNYLGTKSTLRGRIRATEMPDGWQGEFSGHLENVDLNDLVSSQFPHRLTGGASISVEKAVVDHGRLEEFNAAISAGPGIIGESLLSAAVDQLKMRRDPAVAADGSFLRYDALRAILKLDSNGLKLSGECLKNPTGVVLWRHTGAILWEPVGGPLPITALVKALVPDSRLQVPATRQTDWLLNLLPIPDVLPHDPSAPPEARLRLPDGSIRR
jgi:hypothetical protein